MERYQLIEWRASKNYGVSAKEVPRLECVRQQGEGFGDKRNHESCWFVFLTHLCFSHMQAEGIDKVLYCMNTCMVENSNIRRLKWLRKDRFYYRSYEARSMLSAMLENLTYVVICFNSIESYLT